MGRGLGHRVCLVDFSFDWLALQHLVFESPPPPPFTRCCSSLYVQGGSLGKGTAVRNTADIDLVVFINGLTSIEDLMAQRECLLKRLKRRVCLSFCCFYSFCCCYIINILQRRTFVYKNWVFHCCRLVSNKLMILWLLKNRPVCNSQNMTTSIFFTIGIPLICAKGALKPQLLILRSTYAWN